MGGSGGNGVAWLTIRYARHKTYVLTSHRLLSIWDMGKKFKIEEFDLAKSPPPSVSRVLGSGVGDIVLDYRTIRLVGGHDSGLSYAYLDRGLFAVPNAQAVGLKIERMRVRRFEEAEREGVAEMEKLRESWPPERGRE